jgi:hypothetical protein
MQAFPEDAQAALYRPEMQAHFNVQPLRMDRWRAAELYLDLSIGKQCWNDLCKAMNELLSKREKRGRLGGAIPHASTIEKMYAPAECSCRMLLEYDPCRLRWKKPAAVIHIEQICLRPYMRVELQAGRAQGAATCHSVQGGETAAQTRGSLGSIRNRS